MANGNSKLSTISGQIKKIQESTEYNDSDCRESQNIDPNDGSDMTHGDVLDTQVKLQNFAVNKDSSYLAAIQYLKKMTENKIVQKEVCFKAVDTRQFCL